MIEFVLYGVLSLSLHIDCSRYCTVCLVQIFVHDILWLCSWYKKAFKRKSFLYLIKTILRFWFFSAVDCRSNYECWAAVTPKNYIITTSAIKAKSPLFLYHSLCYSNNWQKIMCRTICYSNERCDDDDAFSFLIFPTVSRWWGSW